MARRIVKYYNKMIFKLSVEPDDKVMSWLSIKPYMTVLVYGNVKCQLLSLTFIFIRELIIRIIVFRETLLIKMSNDFCKILSFNLDLVLQLFPDLIVVSCTKLYP